MQGIRSIIDISQRINDSGHNNCQEVAGILLEIGKALRRKDGSLIMICCVAGMSRSVVVCALWLYLSGEKREFESLDAAVRYVAGMKGDAHVSVELLRWVGGRSIPEMTGKALQNEKKHEE